MRTYKRGKGELKSDKTLTNAYKLFKEQYTNDLTEQEYRNIAKAINKRIVKGIRNGEEFSIPYKLGTLRIQKVKVNLNNPRIDFAEFNRTGRKTRHLNEHTGGYYFHHKWDKTTAIVKHKFFFSFIPTRNNKNLLKALLKSGEKTKRDYFG